MCGPEPMGVIREFLSLSDSPPYVPEQSVSHRPSLHPCTCDYSAGETHGAAPGMSLRLPQRRTGTIDGPALPGAGGQSGSRNPLGRSVIRHRDVTGPWRNASRRPGIAEAYRSAVSLNGPAHPRGNHDRPTAAPAIAAPWLSMERRALHASTWPTTATA